MSPDRAGGSEASSEVRGGADPEAETILPNLAVRVWELLVAPGRLFDRLRERPAWLGALAASLALGCVAIWLIPVDLFAEFFRGQVPESAPPEAVESQIDLQVRLRWLNPILGSILGTLITAGVLLFVFNVLMGGAARFAQLFSATVHVWILPALGALATVPLQRATGDFETYLGLHLLTPGLEEGFLLHFLQGLNIWGLWAAVLLGLAAGRLYDRFSERTGIVTVLSLYVLLALGAAGVRTLFGAAAPA